MCNNVHYKSVAMIFINIAAQAYETYHHNVYKQGSQKNNKMGSAYNINISTYITPSLPIPPT